MLKKLHKHLLLILAAALPILAACEKEMEVGTPLYPVHVESFSPKVYIQPNGIGGDSHYDYNIIHTPVSNILPDDTVTFFLKVNRPVDHDVKVTIKESPEAVKDKEGVVTSNILKLENTEFIIPKGSMQASKPVKATLADNAALKDLLDRKLSQGRTTLFIDRVDGAEYSIMYRFIDVLVHIDMTNVLKVNEVSDLALVSPADYSIIDYKGYPVEGLGDADRTTYWFGEFEDNAALIFQPKDGQAVSAIALDYPDDEWFGTTYAPLMVSVYISNDKKSWEYQGLLQRPSSEMRAPFNIKFYLPVNAKYIKVNFLSSYWGKYAAIGEARMYTHK